MIIDLAADETELYDLNKDKDEKNNIVKNNAQLAKYYTDKINQLMQKNYNLRKQLYKSWQERTNKLSPEAIENLKALGYIK